MGEIVDYWDKDGVHREIFACSDDSLQDLTLTHYDLDLKDKHIISIYIYFRSF